MTDRRASAEKLAVAMERFQRLTADSDRFLEEQLGMSSMLLATFEAVMLGASKVSEVAAVSRQHVSSASRAVDQLVTDDLVTREQDPDDRRAVRLGLTDAGKQFAARLVELRLALTEQLLADFTAREASEFADLALRLADNAQAMFTQLDEH